ncbi:lasso peptide biosynthesis B2 protein [Oceanirhabdus sp. W0125-5]|uniref:lasso peptide biosynthesis B2 protein n=1 Tax=Oceanirhabdus sp. W0125-5 TaxID=2999116 RepID=UPI0022F2AF4E|nr:lasso peptide biosynthesis B2 protein [Oceanirhabdus sp. W0125-5]WBW98966.1 lasso peptide biosynthesis B2 protein [Oceanirhabdus sp. W0125-5]
MQKLLILVRKLKTFLTIDRRYKISFVKAYIYTGIVRFLILFIPFKKLSRIIGKSKEESPMKVNDEAYRIAKEVRWVVTKAAMHTPWESKCLVQSITAQKMMKEKGISTTLYLGVKKNSKGDMTAHSWIRCGEYYITGGSNEEGYGVVAKFSN